MTSAASVLPVPLGPANSAAVPSPRALRAAKPQSSQHGRAVAHGGDERAQLLELRRRAARGRPSRRAARATCASAAEAAPRARSGRPSHSGTPVRDVAAASVHVGDGEVEDRRPRRRPGTPRRRRGGAARRRALAPVSARSRRRGAPRTASPATRRPGGPSSATGGARGARARPARPTSSARAPSTSIAHAHPPSTVSRSISRRSASRSPAPAGQVGGGQRPAACRPAAAAAAATTRARFAGWGPCSDDEPALRATRGDAPPRRPRRATRAAARAASTGRRDRRELGSSSPAPSEVVQHPLVDDERAARRASAGRAAARAASGAAARPG